MPSFPLLDVAIGLVFVYLLLSLVASSLNEGLESILRNRANDLEAGIRNILGDRQGNWWASFLPWMNSISSISITREFYSHPMIRNLFRTERRLPTYIPSRNFALAILDLAAKDGSLVRGATVHAPKLDVLSTTVTDELSKAVLPARLKESIITLVTAANGDIRQARMNVENWFNSSMDRVSGGYKSRTQKVLFSIGLVLTVLVNADSVMIYRTLAKSKNLQSIVAAAQAATAPGSLPAKGSQEEIAEAMKQLSGLEIGLGWANEAEQTGGLEKGKLPPVFGSGVCKNEKWPCVDPIGWTLHLLWMHCIGWLITAAAISLGAPFWFDTLNRFIVVRSTVKPQEKSEEETSKDPGPKP